MNLQTFIENYRRAFGEKPGLPLAFWYSDIPAGRTEKIAGCLFRCLPEVRAGNPVSLNAETIGCGGGKFYTGFADMPQRVPRFVSLQERYKETPELVTDCLEALGVPKAEKGWLNLARIDRIEAFDGIDGLFFPATPDMLSGLVAWAMFDTNAPDAVSVPPRIGLLHGHHAGGAGKPPERETGLSGTVRPFGQAVAGSGRTGVHRLDVPFLGNVRNDAPLLSFRHPRLGKGTEADRRFRPGMKAMTKPGKRFTISP